MLLIKHFFSIPIQSKLFNLDVKTKLQLIKIGLVVAPVQGNTWLTIRLKPSYLNAALPVLYNGDPAAIH